MNHFTKLIALFAVALSLPSKAALPLNNWDLSPVIGAAKTLPATLEDGSVITCADNRLTISRINQVPVFTTYSCPNSVFSANNEGVIANYGNGTWLIRYNNTSAKISEAIPQNLFCSSTDTQLVAQYSEEVWAANSQAQFYKFSSGVPVNSYGCTSKGFLASFNNGLYSLNFDRTFNQLSVATPTTIYGTNTAGIISCYGNGIFITRYDGTTTQLTGACPKYAVYIDDNKFIGCWGNGTYEFTYDGQFTQTANACPQK